MPPAEMGGYIMTWTDFRVSQFLDDGDRDSPCNVSLLAIQPTDVAASPRMFYLIQLPCKLEITYDYLQFMPVWIFFKSHFSR